MCIGAEKWSNQSVYSVYHAIEAKFKNKLHKTSSGFEKAVNCNNIFLFYFDYMVHIKGAYSKGLPLRGKVLRCAPNTNSSRCARSVRPAATAKKRGAKILLFIIRLESAPSGGLAACAAKFSAALRTRTARASLVAAGAPSGGLPRARQSSPLRSRTRTARAARGRLDLLLTTKKRGAQILLFIIRLESAPSGGLPRVRQSSPLRSEHEQPALRAAGSTCCYDQKKRSTNLIIYNQIGKCTFRGLAPAGQSSPLRSEHEQLLAPLVAAGVRNCAPAKTP